MYFKYLHREMCGVLCYVLQIKKKRILKDTAPASEGGGGDGQNLYAQKNKQH